jgi:hypothetical protein
MVIMNTNHTLIASYLRTDFRIEVVPVPAITSQNQLNFTIAVIPLNGFNDTVSLNLTRVPNGVTAFLERSSGVPPFNVSLILSPLSDFPLERQVLTVTAIGQGINRTQSFWARFPGVNPLDLISSSLQSRGQSVLQGDPTDLLLVSIVGAAIAFAGLLKGRAKRDKEKKEEGDKSLSEFIKKREEGSQ